MTVRVIRILEYVYPDHETAEEDMRRWGVPANGSVRRGGGIDRHRKSMVEQYVISSATMPLRTIEEDKAELLHALVKKQYCQKVVHISGADQRCGRELTVDDVCPQMHMHVDHPGGT